MAIPKYDAIYKELLIAISDGDAYSIDAVRNKVAEMKGVTEDERTILLESGSKPIFNDRVGWARTYLKAAGLLSYPKRGFSQITDEGRRVLSDDSVTIDNNLLRNYASFIDFQSRSRNYLPTAAAADSNDQSESNATPAERLESAFCEINSSLEDELLSEIMGLSSAFFEKLVVMLLVKMGYGGSLGEDAGLVTRMSGDEGIDGVIREDKLGFSNIYIQAKKWDIARKVNRPDIQAFVGAIANKAGKGLFITTASFSDGAKQCAKENHVVLIDGNKLTSLMNEYGLGVSITQTYDIKKIDSDFFSE
ncbi:MAG: restriction endonuclease [Clostridiales Family XIII bacterium]|jgi:restriction system protein|nr:restriction endonuclease [Clostridiales Family XIII bacterium]